jgi:hypothetical protein
MPVTDQLGPVPAAWLDVPPNHSRLVSRERSSSQDLLAMSACMMVGSFG